MAQLCVELCCSLEYPAVSQLLVAAFTAALNQSLPPAGYNANLEAAGQSDARLAQRLEENNSAFAGLSIDAAVSQMPRLQVPVVRLGTHCPFLICCLVVNSKAAAHFRLSNCHEIPVHAHLRPGSHAALLQVPSLASPAGCRLGAKCCCLMSPCTVPKAWCSPSLPPLTTLHGHGPMVL